MKEIPDTAEITAAYEQHLQSLSDQISWLENRVKNIADILLRISQDKKNVYRKTTQISGSAYQGLNPTTGKQSNVIPFPECCIRRERTQGLTPILARPGNRLPPEIPDFRPLLQRDGLILLAWDWRSTELGERYTAYWVTSTGIPRFYASMPLDQKEFPSARPHHKSYAAEDGIEFYGQKAPARIIHVAPELMKSNPRHRDLRTIHIQALKHYGSNVDFDYKYLLKTEKDRNQRCDNLKDRKYQQAGA